MHDTMRDSRHQPMALLIRGGKPSMLHASVDIRPDITGFLFDIWYLNKLSHQRIISPLAVSPPLVI